VTDRPVHERVRQVVEPSLAAEGFEVVDIERQGGVLRITVDLLVGPDDKVDLLVGPDDKVDLLVGPDHQADRRRGIDLEALTTATHLVSELIDAHDLLEDRTTLEVSSPGIERPLRTPEHFRRFVGADVAVKTRPGTEGDRRVDGLLESADDEHVVVAGRRLAYDDIERARTVFTWPSAGPKGTGNKGTGPKTQAKKIGRAS
jgi:ribosome maturation factor RimP